MSRFMRAQLETMRDAVRVTLAKPSSLPSEPCTAVMTTFAQNFEVSSDDLLGGGIGLFVGFVGSTCSPADPLAE